MKETPLKNAIMLKKNLVRKVLKKLLFHRAKTIPKRLQSWNMQPIARSEYSIR